MVGEFAAATPDAGHWLLTRDPFGVRALYVAEIEDGWAACTDFDTLLRFVDAPEIDTTAFVDCVALRHPLQPHRSLVAGVRRVEPGDSVRLEPDGPYTVSSYQPPPTEVVDGRPARQIVEEFSNLLLTATADRLRDASDVVVFLSGGIDSTALAAAAVETCGADRVRTITLGFEHRIDDPEPALARRTARHLGVEWTFLPTDDNVPFGPWFRRPRGLPLRPATRTARALREMTAGAHLVYGWGGDLVVRGDTRHWSRRLQSGQWLRAAEDALRTIVVHGQRPGFRAHRLHHKIEPVDVSNLPLAPRWRGEAVARAALAAEMERGWRRGIDRMQAPIYPYSFELLEPVDDGPVCTVPFFDVRLVDWAVGVPLAPWFVDKEIIRASLRGRVPDDVRLRPKTPLVQEPRIRVSPEDRAAFEELLQADAARRWLDVDDFRARLAADEFGLAAAVPLVRAASVTRVAAELDEFDDIAGSRSRPWELS